MEGGGKEVRGLNQNNTFETSFMNRRVALLFYYLKIPAVEKSDNNLVYPKNLKERLQVQQ